jgi:hypothetical protein
MTPRGWMLVALVCLLVSYREDSLGLIALGAGLALTTRALFD